MESITKGTNGMARISAGMPIDEAMAALMATASAMAESNQITESKPKPTVPPQIIDSISLSSDDYML